MENVLAVSRDSIAKGSKTFTFASRFFSAKKMQDAALLYHWCRHCDDAIDKCPPAKKAEVVARLREDTARALSGETDGLPAPFVALAHLVSVHGIPNHYPMELIAGMEMDAHFSPPKTFHELELYCYRVAGVVGLMMAHVMGVSREEALKHACDLGIAMQLTNISRDIIADFELNRCYLPLAWLNDEGLTETNYARTENRVALTKVVNRILLAADRYYESGEKGTVYLDQTSAFVILIARYTYAAIGKKVRRAGPKAWDHRQITSAVTKFSCLVKAGFIWFWQLSGRPRWREAPIQRVWRFQ